MSHPASPGRTPQANNDVIKVVPYEDVVKSSHGPQTPPPPVSRPLSAPLGTGSNNTGARTGGPGIYTIENHVTRGSQRDNHVHTRPKRPRPKRPEKPKKVVADRPLPFYTYEFDNAHKVRKKPCLPPNKDFLTFFGILTNFPLFFLSRICAGKAQEDFDARRYRCGKVRAVLAFVFCILTFLTPVIIALIIVIVQTV